MLAEKVVIIEDDEDIMEVLTLYMKNEGYSVAGATNVADGMLLIERAQPDVIVLDINLPDGNGFQLAQSVRQFSDAILIFLTANDSVDKKLEGFALGADDYLTKPFIPKELLARIQAHLKRHTKVYTQLRSDSLVIDFEQMQVTKHGEIIPLFVKEKQLLFYLAEHANKVIPFETLLDYIWGFDGIVDQKTLSVHISNLRRKIEDTPSHPRWIQTIRGFGYKFTP